jgi:hypothetical protein
VKSIDVSELQRDLDKYLSDQTADAFVVTRNGRPCAVVHIVADDVETAELAHSTEFWHMIEQRRREPTVTWEDAKRELT